MNDALTDADADPSSDDAAKENALAIWHAAVDAVRAKTLTERTVQLDGNVLGVIAHDLKMHRLNLDKFKRACIVGAGKAVGGMAIALENTLSGHFDQRGQLFGLVNVPAGNAESPRFVAAHEARPVGMNEPTIAACQGAERILDMVRALRKDDLCIVLLTGGGSALLPAPIEGLSLDDKVRVTRYFSGAGANIVELNAVRRQLSRIKGGRLASACGAGYLLTLVISDVLSDDMASIASGPTVATDDREAAFAALKKFDPQRTNIPPAVWETVESSLKQPCVRVSATVDNVILANNQTAVLAASVEAERRGFQVESLATDVDQPSANALGMRLAAQYRRLLMQPGGGVIVGGGEPTVQLAPVGERGVGGRNQQAVLSALIELAKSDTCEPGTWVLSGGTDGEDGPTDAAGAIAGFQQIERIRQMLPEAIDALATNNAYPLLDRIGALVKTGLTGTNVCDVQLVLSVTK